MKVLSIHFGHDSSCALVVDGKVVAAVAEERFTQLKHYSLMPTNSLQFCLSKAKLSISDIDLIVIPAIVTRQEVKALLNLEEKVAPEVQGENVNKDLSYYIKYFLITLIQRLKQTTLIELPVYMKNYDASKVEIMNIEHHLAHAASAYYASGFKDSALVFTSDGSGDGLSLTVWLGSDGKLTPLLKVGREGSFGAFYGTVTEALGWIVGDGEGKVMGLAPYGSTKKTKGRLEFIRPHFKDGKLIRAYNWGWPGMWFEEGTEHWHFKESVAVKKLAQKYGAENVAAEAQRVLEEELLGIVKYWVEKTGVKRIAASGGVFLNVKANQRLWQELDLDDYYVFPDSGDGGVSVGGALYGYYTKNNQTKMNKIRSVYWGPDYSNAQIEKLLKNRLISYKKLGSKQLISRVAKLLADGKIVGWFQGRMEMGPRALGSRSILMDPRKLKNKDIINKKVKYREAFRPFCPSILEEKMSEYIEDIPDCPFMIISGNVKKDKIKTIPAVTHVDGTARPQAVGKKTNVLYYDLIKAFDKLTGVPVLLNTSFNIKGKPIVCTPQDAIKCFFDTGIDYLVLGNFVVAKKEMSI